MALDIYRVHFIEKEEIKEYTLVPVDPVKEVTTHCLSFQLYLKMSLAYFCLIMLQEKA